MIYTLTLNPAIDYVVKAEKFLTGALNRLDEEHMFVGGKGINVSRVLKELGVETVALGFVAGFTGNAIKEGVEKFGIPTDFVMLPDGNSRINVKIKSQTETEINGKGPMIRSEDRKALFEKLNMLEKGDVLVLSGSIAQGLDNKIYEEIMQSLEEKNIDILVDTTDECLLNSLKHKPFLIKPNKDELEQLFGCRIDTDAKTVLYAKELLKMGAKRVLVSLGKQGAICVDSDETVYKVSAAKGRLINSVGAGDSMVAGFLAGYLKTGDIKKALKIATAAGSATAFSNDLATKVEIVNLIDEIVVEVLD